MIRSTTAVAALDRYLARRVILAVGRRGVARRLGVPGEEREIDMDIRCGTP